MKTRIGSLVVALALFSGAAEAQKPGMLGIGVAIGAENPLQNMDEESLPVSSLLFPMNFGAFRLEPVLGFTSGSLEFNDPFFGQEEESLSQLTFGVGVYYQKSLGDGFFMYGGPRFGLMRSSQSQKSGGDPEQSVTQTDSFFGAALGGEHFFSNHFSLGVEARFTRFMSGEPEFDPALGGEGPDFKAHINMTSGIVAARFYF